MLQLENIKAGAKVFFPLLMLSALSSCGIWNNLKKQNGPGSYKAIECVDTLGNVLYIDSTGLYKIMTGLDTIDRSKEVLVMPTGMTFVPNNYEDDLGVKRVTEIVEHDGDEYVRSSYVLTSPTSFPGDMTIMGRKKVEECQQYRIFLGCKMAQKITDTLAASGSLRKVNGGYGRYEGGYFIAQTPELDSVLSRLGLKSDEAQILLRYRNGENYVSFNVSKSPQRPSDLSEEEFSDLVHSDIEEGLEHLQNMDDYANQLLKDIERMQSFSHDRMVTKGAEDLILFQAENNYLLYEFIAQHQFEKDSNLTRYVSEIPANALFQFDIAGGVQGYGLEYGYVPKDDNYDLLNARLYPLDLQRENYRQCGELKQAYLTYFAEQIDSLETAKADVMKNCPANIQEIALYTEDIAEEQDMIARLEAAEFKEPSSTEAEKNCFSVVEVQGRPTLRGEGNCEGQNYLGEIVSIDSKVVWKNIVSVPFDLTSVIASKAPGAYVIKVYENGINIFTQQFVKPQ